MTSRQRSARVDSVAQMPPPSEDEDSVSSDNESEESEGGEDNGGEWKVATGKSGKVKYVCRGNETEACGKVIGVHNKEKSVSCDGCETWFHIKCQGLSVAAFKALRKYKFVWLCDRCQPSLHTILHMGKQLEARIDSAEQKILKALDQSRPKRDLAKQLESKISSMEKTVMGKINEHQEKVTTTLQHQSKAVEAMPKYTSEINKSAMDLKAMIKSKEEKEDRETNIILHNLPESHSGDSDERKEHDKSSFKKVVSALLGEETRVDMIKVYRLGKKAEPTDEHDRSKPKPRLMLVKLTKKEDVQALMKKRWNLREVGFPNIYMTHDLTPEERQKQRELRSELAAKGKDQYRILQGKIVPRN